jgi:hypothetical protein
MLTDHGMILEALAAIQSGATAVVKADQLASLTKIAGTAVLGRLVRIACREGPASVE